MLDVIWLIPAFPLAGFVLILLFGRRLGQPGAGLLATAMVAASFVVSVGAYFDLLVDSTRPSAPTPKSCSRGSRCRRSTSTWRSSPIR